MITYLYIALGGALGSVARHWISTTAAERYGDAFPWGTLIVNVSGSFVIGLCAAWIAPDGQHEPARQSQVIRQFIMIGLCGGYTTFSAFSLQTLKLLQERAWLHAGGNMALSVIACLLAVWLGYFLGALLHPARN